MAKRKSEDLSGLDAPPPVKVKIEGHSTDYSEDVKKKLNTASRTSTACDRCRVRKMRCDDQFDGCAPCRQNQTECKTTDRITGKATVRGHVENLERKIKELENYNRQLQTRVVSLGGDVTPDESFVDQKSPTSGQWPENPGASGSASDKVTIVGDEHSESIDSASYKSGDPIHLPNFRNGLSGNNYVGVSTGNTLLSSIRGTSMNVLGMEIDLADYASADLDEPDPYRTDVQPVYNKSYRACIQTAFGTSPKLSKVELPPRKEGMIYAQIYFNGINPYLPILHQPTFMRLLTRIYDDLTFHPSIAEIVMVHAMFAIMHCQLSVRGARDEAHKTELNHSSNFHYHYALGFFPQLMASHTLADVQALTLLGLHLRNFPKPGACWMLVSITLNVAIELGLHRSAKCWAATAQNPSALENEIRKRVFWALLTLLVSASGNLGRPLSLRSEDWDVEMPELIDDEFISENDIDTSKSGKCKFPVGLQGFLVMPIFIDLYNSIYAVKRSPQTYIDTVRGLERRIREWQEQWPPEIMKQSTSEHELGHSHAQYLEIVPLHMRLLLRHPSLSLTTNAEFNRESLTVCLEVSRKMLHHVKQLQKYQSLDGTWQTGALYVLAISTTLYAHWERRDQVTPSALATLKEEMAAWLSIIGDMGHYMGSGKKLQNTVRVTIERTVGLLSQHLASKNAQSLATTSMAPAPRSVPPATQPPAQAVYDQPSTYAPYENPNTNNLTSAAQPHLNGQVTAFQQSPSVTTHTTSVTHYNPPPPPPPPPYPYQSQQPQYTSNPSTYEQQNYDQPHTLPATAAAANAYMGNYQQPQQAPPAYASNPAFSAPTTYTSPGSPSSWRQFAGDMTSNIDPGTDYLSSASALMQLGRSDGPSQQEMPMGMTIPQGDNVNGGPPQSWPFLLYENGPDVG